MTQKPAADRQKELGKLAGQPSHGIAIVQEGKRASIFWPKRNWLLVVGLTLAAAGLALYSAKKSSTTDANAMSLIAAVTGSLCLGSLSYLINLVCELRRLSAKARDTKKVVDVYLDSVYTSMCNFVNEWDFTCEDVRRSRIKPEDVAVRGRLAKRHLERAGSIAKRGAIQELQLDAAYLNDIRDSTRFTMAVWSEDPLAWTDPMVIYYLSVHGTKSIQEYRNRASGSKLIQSPDTAAFKDECRRILDKLADGDSFLSKDGKLPKAQGDSQYFSLRFLLFPKDTYKLHHLDIAGILSLHHQARIHCVPLVKEKLLAAAGGEAVRFEKLFGLMGKPALDGDQPTCPDFMLAAELNGTRDYSKAVWFVNNGEDEYKDSEEVWNASIGVMQLLAKHYKSALWKGYAQDDVFGRVLAAV